MYSISQENWDKLNSLLGSPVVYNNRKYIAKSWQHSEKHGGILFLCVAVWYELGYMSSIPIREKDERFFNLQTIIDGRL